MANKIKKSDLAKLAHLHRQNSSSFQWAKVLTVLAILSALAAYYLYSKITTPPPLPQIDLDAWWGPYPINQNQDVSIRPFKIEFSNVIVNDLRERLLHRRPFVPALEGAGFTYGFNSGFLTRVLDYWQNQYNFRDREAFLNQYNHYKTNIQGLDIHYVHIKPETDGDVEVVPLLLVHGWPGSFRELYELAARLRAPRAGYTFLFELVIPSLPGFGYSDGAARPGLGPAQAAAVLHQLMLRLGLRRYVTAGSGAAPALAPLAATLFPAHVLGLHVSAPAVTLNAVANVCVFLGQFWPSLLVEPELQDRLYPWSEKASRIIEESGYLHQQATKPDTIGIALTDSPAGLAAYILEKFSAWSHPENARASDGNILAKFSLTHLLDNVMVYWATNSATTAARMHAEAYSLKQLALRLDEVPTPVPTWGIKFRHELVFYPDALLRIKYTNYLRSTLVAEGGHFAALENPELMAEDIYEATKAFREFHGKSWNLKATTPQEAPKSAYDFSVKDIHGNEVKLDKYRGHVSLIVNVASHCGYTDNHYEELNQLYEKYSSKGLRILAFPCNQFGGQEPGTMQDILTFTKSRKVRFDLFDKVEVNGDNAHPLWVYLKRVQSGAVTDAIKWNFSKFIVDKNGAPVARFGPSTSPLELEPQLAKYL